MLADVITAHDMKTAAREALGQAASDDDVLLGAIVLTWARRGMDNATICQMLGLLERLAGDLTPNLALHLQAAVNLANDERAQQHGA